MDTAERTQILGAPSVIINPYRFAISSGDWWLAAGVTPTAAYTPIGAANLDASRVNLANSGTYDLIDGVPLTFNSTTGWKGNGTSTYFNTGFTPSSNNLTMIVKFNGAATSGSHFLLGSYAGSPNYQFTYLASVHDAFAPNNRIYSNGGYKTVSGAIASGVMGVAGNIAYLNGMAESGTIGSSSGTTFAAIFIGAVDAVSVPAYFFDAYITSVWIWQGTLTAEQMAAQMAAMP